MWKCQNCQAENQTLTSRTTTGSLDHWTVNCLWAVTALLLSTVPGHRISSEKGKLYSTQPPCHDPQLPPMRGPCSWALPQPSSPRGSRNHSKPRPFLSSLGQRWDGPGTTRILTAPKPPTIRPSSPGPPAPDEIPRHPQECRGLG